MFGSLRARLFVMTLIVSAAAAITVGVITSRVASREITDMNADDDMTRTRTAATEVSAFVEDRGSFEGVEVELDRLARLNNRQYVIVAGDERVVAASPRTLAASEITVEPGGRLRIITREPGGQPGTEIVDERLLINPPSADLMLAGIGTGARLLSLTDPESAVTLRRDAAEESVGRRLWIGIAIVLLVALVVSSFVSARLAAPLSELRAAAAGLARGDTRARVPVRSNDEIGQLAREFNTLITALDRNERIRQGMVSDIAHELRTPVTNMQCIVESIQDGLVVPDTPVMVSLQEEIQLLARLIEDLQVLALADAGELRVEAVSVEVRGVLESAVLAAGATAATRGLELELRDVPAGVRVLADPGRLSQIVRILVANAIEYTQPKGSISLRAEQRGDSVLIAVADTGPGIPAEHVSLIFERFYRVDKSRSRRSGGSGLGLAIARNLVELQGGTIGVTTAEGEGAEFWFTLPRVV